MIFIIKFFLTCVVGIIGISTLTYDNNTNQIDIDSKILNNYNVLETKEEIIDKEIKEEIIDDVEEINHENNKEIIEPEKNQDSNQNNNDDEIDVLEVITGKMSGYGPDCYGCTSNRTASGYYVGDGNIYYEDETYGKIRIVSADSKYSFGTIVRISNISFQNEPIIAIVLDRGGAIGLDKKIQFDLLFEKEAEASLIGIEKNVSFEILRLGY